MSAIIDVEGIGEVYAEKLKEAGISTTGALLKEGSSPAGRKQIEKSTGIGHKFILRWTNHVDLYRIKGVQKQYAELLEASGVTPYPSWPSATIAPAPQIGPGQREKKVGAQVANAKAGRGLGRPGQKASSCDHLLIAR